MRVLKRKPLKYRVVAQELESETGYPPIDFVFHDRVTVPPGLVRQMLVKRVGLSQSEALKLL